MSTSPKPPKADQPKALEVDLLPDVTSDELREEDSRDAWLRGEVPPHHGS